MISNFKFQISNSERGVSLIITFFITLIILFVVLAISTILYSQIKVIRNIGNSVVAFYAADSGVEKVLYYDKNIFPGEPGEGEGVGLVNRRGLCYMCDSPERSCPKNDLNSSVNCSCETPEDIEPNGCKKNQCDNCEVKFSTTFDGKRYDVITRVYKGCEEADDSDCTLENPNTYLTINSFGAYENVKRAVELKTKESGVDADCTNAVSIDEDPAMTYATPYCIDYGWGVDIYAAISDATYQIDKVEITVRSSDGSISDKRSLDPNLPWNGNNTDGTWHLLWTGPAGTYYADIHAEDTKGCKADFTIESFDTCL